MGGIFEEEKMGIEQKIGRRGKEEKNRRKRREGRRSEE